MSSQEHDPSMAIVGGPEVDDGGYESPSFDFVPSEPESDRPSKKSKRSSQPKLEGNGHRGTLEDEEELALRLLGGH